jgi:hypothetical protein
MVGHNVADVFSDGRAKTSCSPTANLGARTVSQLCNRINDLFLLLDFPLRLCYLLWLWDFYGKWLVGTGCGGWFGERRR